VDLCYDFELAVRSRPEVPFLRVFAEKANFSSQVVEIFGTPVSIVCWKK